METSSALQYIEQYLLDELSPVGLGSFSTENRWKNEAKPEVSTSQSQSLYSQASSSDSCLTASNFNSLDVDDFFKFSPKFPGFEFESKPQFVHLTTPNSFSSNANAFNFQVKPQIARVSAVKPHASSNSEPENSNSGEKSKHYRGVRQRPWGSSQLRSEIPHGKKGKRSRDDGDGGDESQVKSVKREKDDDATKARDNGDATSDAVNMDVVFGFGIG
ncbi:hypothetical protein V6N12_044312 [Hibiscus sabdariffa]|uniref:Uncharacterized protein n=1 Tax=Hibiscus sabdariffa TaxID=183260 RepID=A0ABR2DJU7_9ROSI